MSFDTLGLPEALTQAVRDAGYDNPTEVQARAIPPALEGRDLRVASSTGSGKTASFVLPMIERQLLRLREYVSPNPPMTPECEAAIAGRMWWRLGSDWIRYGDYVCPQGYDDDEMQAACGTHSSRAKIDHATWDAWCAEFADILRPVYEGARAASNKPY